MKIACGWSVGQEIIAFEGPSTCQMAPRLSDSSSSRQGRTRRGYDASAPAPCEAPQKRPKEKTYRHAVDVMFERRVRMGDRCTQSLGKIVLKGSKIRFHQMSPSFVLSKSCLWNFWLQTTVTGSLECLKTRITRKHQGCIEETPRVVEWSSSIQSFYLS